jgi:hypothetical protein
VQEGAHMARDAVAAPSNLETHGWR